MTNKRILITGGAGFIGSHLAEKLVNDNNHITIIDNLSTGSIDNLINIRSKITFIERDLKRALKTDINLWEYDYVFHLAGNPYVPPSVKNPKFDFKSNLENTFILLEGLRKTKNPPHLFNASSGAVYGNPASIPIKESDPTIPVAPYGVSKLSAERYASVYSLLYGIKTTNLRFFSLFGPRQKKQVIFDLILKVKKNPQVLEIFGDGSQERDFIYISDLIEAILLIAKKDNGHGQSYNIATGNSATINKIAKTICKICDVAPKFEYSLKNRPGDAEKWQVDISKIKKLGFKPRTDLEEGIKKIKAWTDSNQKLKNIYE